MVRLTYNAIIILSCKQYQLIRVKQYVLATFDSDNILSWGWLSIFSKQARQKVVKRLFLYDWSVNLANKKSLVEIPLFQITSNIVSAVYNIRLVRDVTLDI